MTLKKKKLRKSQSCGYNRKLQPAIAVNPWICEENAKYGCSTAAQGGIWHLYIIVGIYHMAMGINEMIKT